MWCSRWRGMGASAVAAALMGLIGAGHAGAAPPSRLAYSGHLTYEGSGAAFNGAVQVQAALYDAESGGALLWTSGAAQTVSVQQGALSLVLGTDSAPIDAALVAQGPRWLELTLEGVTLTPRQQLVSVPYALVAADADALGGTPAHEFATLTDLDSAIAAGGSGAVDESFPLAFGRTSGGGSRALIDFGRRFVVPPVVVATVHEHDNSGAMELRINTRTRWDTSVYTYCNGAAAADAIGWLAVEPGVHVLDGRTLIAGSTPTSTATTTVTFPQPFANKPAVVVLPSLIGVQSGAITCRVTSVSATGFTTNCWVGGSAGVPTGVEWIALEPTGGQVIALPDGRRMQAGFSTSNASQGTVTFPVAFSGPPRSIVASLYELNNSGATSVRVNYLPTATSFPYQSHTCGSGAAQSEEISWIAIE